MAKSWTINGRGIATIIRNTTHILTCQLGQLVTEAWTTCPNCKHSFDHTDISLQLPGLPAGLNFDPSDLQLLEHLEEKVSVGNSKSHRIIDDFIPTIKEAEGICYTHPENLPGIKMDGSSTHFFHIISNAYGSGHRKRRKISMSDHAVCDDSIRWHKTGKSKAITDNGIHKGFKKILVLYKGSKKGGGKVNKSNWVMHQYHLGTEEEENDGELVVSKVFCQLPSKQTVKSEVGVVHDESDPFLPPGDFSKKKSDPLSLTIDPTTPMTNTPQPLRLDSSPWESEQNQEEEEFVLPAVQPKVEAKDLAWHTGTPQAVDNAALPDLDEHPLCNEVPTDAPADYNNMDALHCFSDLDNLLVGTPPDFGTLIDMQFPSQDSLNSWLARM